MPFYPDKISSWNRIREFLDSAETVFITTHMNPDGDAIGSVTALSAFLKRFGKTVRVVIESPVPAMYRFLDPGGTIESYPDGPPGSGAPTAGDLVIFLDLGQFSRTGTVEKFLSCGGAPLVIIDHHRPEQVYVDLAVVVPGAESTGSLVYDLILHLDESKMTPSIAIAILTAMVTDTGYFRYSNTSALTHEIASSLYHQGARAVDIRKMLESGQPFSRQKLLGLALANLSRSSDGNVVWAHITRDMFDESGALRENTDGIIDQIRIVRGAKIASLIIEEQPGRWKVSFRTSERIPANEIAAFLGGGGHLRASGATVTGTLEEAVDLMLHASERVLDGERGAVHGNA